MNHPSKETASYIAIKLRNIQLANNVASCI